MIPNSPFFLIYIAIRRGVTPGPVAQGHANRTGGGGFRMDGNDHSAVQSRRGERHIRAIEEGAKGSCLLLFPPCSSLSIRLALPFLLLPLRISLRIPWVVTLVYGLLTS